MYELCNFFLTHLQYREGLTDTWHTIPRLLNILVARERGSGRMLVVNKKKKEKKKLEYCTNSAHGSVKLHVSFPSGPECIRH